MRVAYVAGPYRSNDGIWGESLNIVAARRVAVELWRMGFAVMCPHSNTAHMDGAMYPDDRHADAQVFLRGDLEILHRCDLLVTVPGWEQSTGARGEVAEAKASLIPVLHWPEDQERLARMARPQTVVASGKSDDPSAATPSGGGR